VKREAELKSKLNQELKRQLPGFYVLAYATNGAPDRSIVGAGRQSNWEMKHGTPDFKSPADQELMCCRMAIAAHCRYVIWYERGSVQKTMIVHPKQILERISWDVIPESFCVGFDMRWLVKEIRKVHYGA
jgi:hypothetical protein